MLICLLLPIFFYWALRVSLERDRPVNYEQGTAENSTLLSPDAKFWTLGST
jgi:hypothetical protein